MKGVIFTNFIYLVVFILIYLLSLPTIQSVMGSMATIFTNFNGVDLWSGIPSDTWFLLNLLLYVLVPLAAIAWFIWSSKPREYYPVGY